MATPSPDSARILVVEDEPTINQAVTDRLRAEGFLVDQAHDGPGAVTSFEAHRPDLVVLDVMLPGFDGLRGLPAHPGQPPRAGADAHRALRRDRPARRPGRRCRRLRHQAVLDARGGGPDPCAAAPRGARGRAGRPAGRRSRCRAGDRPSGAAGRRGRAARAPDPAEFDLLCALAAEPGTVRSRDVLMLQVWGWSDAAGTRTLDSHVKACAPRSAAMGPHRARRRVRPRGAGVNTERPLDACHRSRSSWGSWSA